MTVPEHAPLTPRREQILDALTARLVPTDETGAGAREACVTRYISRALATVYAVHVPAYDEGLDALDRHAMRRHDRGFVELTEAEQDDLLVDVEAGRLDTPESSPATFFELVLAHTHEGMFGAPEWGGNADHVGWKLLGYPGPRLVWTEAEQRLDVTVEPSFDD